MVSGAQLGPSSHRAKDGRVDSSLPPGFVPTTPSVPETQLGGSRLPPKDNRNDSSFPPGFVPATPSVRSARDTPRARTNAFPVPPPPILDNTPRGVRTSIYAGQDAPYIPGSRPSRVYPSGPSMPGTPAAGARRLSGIYNGNPPLPTGIYAPNNPPPPGGPYAHSSLPFPALRDQYMSLSNQGSPHRELDNDPLPMTMPVIPPPSANYPRDSDDVESSSNSGSTNTLSTPPPSNRRLPTSRQYQSTRQLANANANTEGALPVPPPVSTPRAMVFSSRSNAGATPGMSNIPLSGEQVLRDSASRHSLRTSNSHKHFDKDAYLDPAFLASGSNSAEKAGDARSARG